MLDVYNLVQWVQQEFGFPPEGCIAGVNKARYTFPGLGGDPYDWLKLDPVVITAYNHLVIGADIQERRRIPWVQEQDFFETGFVFVANSNPYLGMLEKLGMYEKSPVMISIVDSDLVDRLVANYLTLSGPPAVYEYRCIADVPLQLQIEYH
jgi:hypothetical protein